MWAMIWASQQTGFMYEHLAEQPVLNHVMIQVYWGRCAAPRWSYHTWLWWDLTTTCSRFVPCKRGQTRLVWTQSQKITPARGVTSDSVYVELWRISCVDVKICIIKILKLSICLLFYFNDYTFSMLINWLMWQSCYVKKLQFFPIRRITVPYLTWSKDETERRFISCTRNDLVGHKNSCTSNSINLNCLWCSIPTISSLHGLDWMVFPVIHGVNT